jgi:senataxin
MRDEAEIMDELHGLDGYIPPPLHHQPTQQRSILTVTFSELRSFPPEAHWFCPRRHYEDYVDYDNPDEPEEDMSTETKRELIQDAKRRHHVAYKFSLIIGMAPDIAGKMLHDYTDRLNEFLTRCDKCVRHWHMGRKPYLKELAM